MIKNANFVLWVIIVMGIVFTSYAASTKQPTKDTKQEFGLHPSQKLWKNKEKSDDIKRYYGLDTGFD